MPDGEACLTQNLKTRGLDALDARVRSLGGERIPASKLHRYLGRHPISGWQIWVEFSDGPRLLRILVDRRFPWTPPKFALGKPPRFLSWAHVERDGILCLTSNASSFNPYDPVGVFDQMLAMAVDLIEDLLHGRRAEDFKDEFLSYWSWAETKKALSATLSILRPEGPSRLICVWRGRDFDLVAENDEAAMAWLRNRFPRSKKRRWKTSPGVLVWTKTPLIPAQFPTSGSQLYDIANDDGRSLLVDLLGGRTGSSITTLLASRSTNGPCLARVTINPPPANSITRGFRPAHLPTHLLTSRFFGGATVIRSRVERVDSSWIHGRDQDTRHPALKAANVTVLGCGSVGAAVAVLLAQAGVGRLRLVDHDLLTAANVGRHPLGVKYLGHFKANALAVELRARFPHIDVEIHNCRWQDLPAGFDLFSGSELIVSAIGDWVAEGALNVAHVAEGRMVPIVYGWTEAEALGGHAIVIDKVCGCLQCGLDHTGAPKFSVTSVPNDAGLKQEPACGAVYQPYGPAELSHIVAMIADLVIDTILDGPDSGAHRVWISGERRLKSVLGASWTKDLLAEVPDPGLFPRMIERRWSRSNICPNCQVRAAA